MSRKILLLLAFFLPLSASALPDTSVSSLLNDQAQQAEPLSNYGNPSYYHVRGKRYNVLKSAFGYDKVGIASWYGDDFHGELTSNRETYDMYEMTAASRDLPLPTYVKVTNMENGREVIVRVNDRGPFHADRLIDLSYAAAYKLGFTRDGTTMVHVTAITSPVLDGYCSPHACEFLQIGAFHSRHNALNYREQLIKMTHYPIRVQPDTNEQTPIFRVQVGPFKAQAALIEEQQILKAKGIDQAIAVLG